MKWSRLQKLVESLLAGDHVLPKDAEQRIALLEYALEEMASRSESLVLQLTKEEAEDSNRTVLRQSYGGNVIVRAMLPSSDEDTVDIDTSLTFGVARLMASFISKEKFSLHDKRATEIISRFNEKVSSYRTELEEY